MDTLNRSLTLNNEVPEYPGLDFDALRKEGINYLQQLAGNTWTDHNVHDPGITILDQLCYALTDLSYRISFDTRELLAKPDGRTYDSLYSPATILTVNPVTLADFRKVLLDIPGVKNAWIEKIDNPQPAIYFDPKKNTLSLHQDEKQLKEHSSNPLNQVKIKGLYQVFIAKTSRKVSNTELLNKVCARLYECRNLCEDFDDIRVMEEDSVTLRGNIEIGSTKDVNVLAANILYRLSNWLSPAIKFYTLPQMLAKGKTVDEIMDGPALYHGFIDDDELKQLTRRSKLYASDLIREIMSEPDVRVTDELWMKVTSQEQENNWALSLDIHRFPVLDEDACLGTLKFQKNGHVLNINKEAVSDYLLQLRNTGIFPELPQSERDMIPDVPDVRNIGDYYSIQNHFPEIYGIGEIGLPESAPPLRKAQAKQLKAYLLFFEQILANYFQQAAGIKNLFAFDNKDIHTYFHQSLVGKVPGVEELLSPGYNDENMAILTETTAQALERKDRFLNHLLARFGESLNDYSVWLNDSYPITNANAEGTDAIEQEKNRLALYKNALIKSKLNFLDHYPVISAHRGKAFNYSQLTWGSDNISGLEKRIAGKLGILDYTRGSLTDNRDGFHMIEHILLRPMLSDRTILDRFMDTHSFSGFKNDTDGFVICQSAAHGLQNGDIIVINDKGIETEYTVSAVLVDSFQIKAGYSPDTIAQREKNNEPRLLWKRTDINSTIFAFTKQSAEILDPYSFQLTFVFADSNKRFKDNKFRKFIETTVREETPAHLTVYIKWMDDTVLKRFENAFQVFLNELKELSTFLQWPKKITF
jgi:hypothetical protein